MARLQQAIAESHELVLRRSTVLEALNLRTGEHVLEVGCGGGYYAWLRCARPPSGGSGRSNLSRSEPPLRYAHELADCQRAG